MSKELYKSHSRNPCCEKCLYPCDDEGEVTLEEVNCLYEFLQGEPPPCLSPANQPQVDDKTAFSIIYFLQEVLRIVPEKYERCEECGRLIDADCSGYYYEDKGNYCDCCGYRLFEGGLDDD